MKTTVQSGLLKSIAFGTRSMSHPYEIHLLAPSGQRRTLHPHGPPGAHPGNSFHRFCPMTKPAYDQIANG